MLLHMHLHIPIPIPYLYIYLYMYIYIYIYLHNSCFIQEFTHYILTTKHYSTQSNTNNNDDDNHNNSTNNADTTKRTMIIGNSNKESKAQAPAPSFQIPEPARTSAARATSPSLASSEQWYFWLGVSGFRVWGLGLVQWLPFFGF